MQNQRGDAEAITKMGKSLKSSLDKQQDAYYRLR